MFLLGDGDTMADQGSKLTLPLPRDFNLGSTVCSYGYFLLAPNYWDKKNQCLCHTFGDFSGTDQRVKVRVKQSVKQKKLIIDCDQKVRRGWAEEIKGRLIRILRVDMDMQPWFKLFPKAKKEGYGRLYRCGTLWEDLVKTMTSCNVTWPGTVRMNELLCRRVGEGAFPSPKQILAFSEDRLQARCRLGYRAKRIYRLAQNIVSGDLDLGWFEEPGRTAKELYKAIKKIYGLGDFSAHNVLQLLGHFQHVPIDTETYRHFRQVHRKIIPEGGKALRRCDQEILDHYQPYQPYAFLAYWYELQQGYQAKTGNPQDWPALSSASFTAKNLG